MLALLSEWNLESKESNNPNHVIPKTIFESYAWLVYGIKVVAAQIPDGGKIVQCRGSTYDVEHEFARNRQLNYNLTL